MQTAPLPYQRKEVEPPVTTCKSCWAGKVGAPSPADLELLDFADSNPGGEQVAADLLLEFSLLLTSGHIFKTSFLAQRCSWCSFAVCFPSLLLNQVMWACFNFATFSGVRSLGI